MYLAKGSFNSKVHHACHHPNPDCLLTPLSPDHARGICEARPTELRHGVAQMSGEGVRSTPTLHIPYVPSFKQSQLSELGFLLLHKKTAFILLSGLTILQKLLVIIPVVSLESPFCPASWKSMAGSGTIVSAITPE